jgi:hypothetical protein
MMLYMHLGCELDGSSKSIAFLDGWLHTVPLWERLSMLNRIFDL